MGRLVRSALSQTGRLIGTALAVTLAVGLVSGTFMLTDTVSSAFGRASGSVTATSDIVIRATVGFTVAANGPESEPMPESLVAKVAALPGIQALWAKVQGYAAMVDRTGKAMAPNGLPTIGASWEPGNVVDVGRAPRAGEVAIDRATARRYHLRLGETIRILFQGSTGKFTIAGVLRPGADAVAATRAIFDPGTAQHVLGQAGQISEIAVRTKPGTSATALRARINAMLPSRDEAVTSTQVADEAGQAWTKSLGFLPIALLVLAAVALVAGALLIGNTFSILVGQRTRELGLLRALGASRAQLRSLVLVEALALGVSASLAGSLLGLGLAHGLLALVRDIGLAVPSTAVVFRIRSAGAGVVCGVAVTTVAGFLPARRATLVSPVTALTGQGSGTVRPPGHRIAAAAAAAAAAVTLLAAGAGHALPTLPAAAVGAGAVLVGVALLLPVLAGPAAWVVGTPLVALFGQPAALARQNAMRNPRRTAATAAALTIGIGLVGVVAIVGASMKASATASVQQTLLADAVVVPTTVSGSSAGVPPAVAQRLRHVPDVAMISEVGGGQWGLAGTTETLLALDPATVTRMHQVDAGSTAVLRRLDDKGVLVRDTVAEHRGWQVGDMVPMTFAHGGTRPVPIRGLFSTTAVPTDYVISLKSFLADYAQPLFLEIDLRWAKGIAAATAQANVRRALADLAVVEVRGRSEVLAAQQAQVDKLLTPLAAVLGLTVLIGLLGIANALSLSVHERTREVGLLRAVGMARSQLRSMIRCEAVIVAGLGAGLGVALSIGFGWASVTAVRHLGMTKLVFPVGQLAVLVAAASAAGLLAATLPARRVARLGVLDAVGTGP